MLKLYAKKLRDIDEQQFPSKGSWEEKIKFLLNYAILASSSQNSQPWLFKIHHCVCEFHRDSSIKATETDERDKNFYTSMGCCVENFLIAARYFKIKCKVIFHDDSRNSIIVTVELSDDKNTTQDILDRELFHAILKRKTHRGAFLSKVIDDKALISAARAINDFERVKLDFITDRQLIEKVVDLNSEAIIHDYKNKGFRKEVSKWMHHNLKKRYDGMHGYLVNISTIQSFIFPWVLRTFDMGKKVSEIFKEMLLTAPILCVFSSLSDDKASWFETGRLLERLELYFTFKQLGFVVSLSAIDLETTNKKLQDALGLLTIPNCLIGVGYVEKKPIYSARHSAQSKIVREVS